MSTVYVFIHTIVVKTSRKSIAVNWVQIYNLPGRSKMHNVNEPEHDTNSLINVFTWRSWEAIGLLCLRANNEHSAQTGQMCRLSWVFVLCRICRAVVDETLTHQQQYKPQKTTIKLARLEHSDRHQGPPRTLLGDMYHLDWLRARIIFLWLTSLDVHNAAYFHQCNILVANEHF